MHQVRAFVVLLTSFLFVNDSRSLDASADSARVDPLIQSVEQNLMPLDAKTSMRPTSLRDRMRHYAIPGISVAVINGGMIKWAKAYGVKDVDTGAVVATNTLFQAGSISKPTAAVGALTLVREGAVSLDGDVNVRLKSWKVPKTELTAGSSVTLREILSHSAGLSARGFYGYAKNAEVPSTRQILDGLPPANSPAVTVISTPGEKWSYSGGGYVVLQQMMTDVRNEDFATLMNKLVFEKVGMRNSTYAQPLPTALEGHASSGHIGGHVIAGKWHTYPEMAAAGLWTTPTDLALLILEIQRDLDGRSDMLLSKELAREMLTPQKGQWGLGFKIIGNGRYRRFTHDGIDEGFEALVVAGTHGEGAIVMTNGQNGRFLAREIIKSISHAYAWVDYDD